MKEITLKLNEEAFALLEEDAKRRRGLSSVNNIGDKLIIRLTEALQGDNQALFFKIENNKLIVRPIIRHDDNR